MGTSRWERNKRASRMEQRTSGVPPPKTAPLPSAQHLLYFFLKLLCDHGETTAV